MNISELYRLTQWIETEIVATRLAEKYQQLHQVLQQHVAGSQPRRSFADQREQLIAALLQVPLEQLSREQRQFLQELGIARAVGEQGVERVEDTLYKNVIDVATSAQAIGDLLQGLLQGIDRSSQIRGGLQDMVGDSLREVDRQVLMRVVFSGNSAMANVADFKHWGELWHDIGYGIAFAHGETAEDVKIVGAASGSVVLELAVSSRFAATASDIILAALQLTEKVQDINQKAEELRRLQLSNNKLILDLEREAEYASRTGVDNISTGIIKKLGLRKNGEGDKITALMKSVRHLMTFIENGGDVDFVIYQDEDAAEQDAPEDRTSPQQLRDVFQRIHRLKKKLDQQQQDSRITQAA